MASWILNKVWYGAPAASPPSTTASEKKDTTPPTKPSTTLDNTDLNIVDDDQPAAKPTKKLARVVSPIAHSFHDEDRDRTTEPFPEFDPEVMDEVTSLYCSSSYSLSLRSSNSSSSKSSSSRNTTPDSSPAKSWTPRKRPTAKPEPLKLSHLPPPAISHTTIAHRPGETPTTAKPPSPKAPTPKLLAPAVEPTRRYHPNGWMEMRHPWGEWFKVAPSKGYGNSEKQELTWLPCLQCAVKGLKCSFSYGKGSAKTAVSCDRCTRNGECFCIVQMRNYVALREGFIPDEYEVFARTVVAKNRTKQMTKRGDVLGLKVQASGRPVYTRCPGVSDEEVEERALDLTERGPKALPMFHQNDKAKNREDPLYRPVEGREFLVDQQIEKLAEMRKKAVAQLVAEGTIEEDEIDLMIEAMREGRLTIK